MNSEKFHQKRDQEFNIITQTELREADPLKSSAIHPNHNESAILKMSVINTNKQAAVEQKPDQSYVGKNIEIRNLSMGYDGNDPKEFAKNVQANTLPAKQILTYTATPLENSQLTVNASMVSPSTIHGSQALQPESGSRDEGREAESGNKDTQSHNYTVQNSESILESESSLDHHGTAMLGADGEVQIDTCDDVPMVSEPVQ